MLLRHLACKDERAAVKTLRGFGKAFAFNENLSARTRYRRSGMPSPRVFGAARGDTAEVCRIQRDAPQWSSVEWSITRFPIWAAVLNYRGSARGLRFTASLRNGAVFPGGRKRPTFLGDRTSVRVVFGSTATFECGRKPAGFRRIRSAAQKFFHR